MHKDPDIDFLRILYSDDAEYAHALSVNAEYKRNFNSDPNNYFLWSDIYRARWIVYGNSEKDLVKILRANNVCSEAIKTVLGPKIDLSFERREKRTDKYQKIIDWCHQNHLVQIDAQAIADIGGVSYPTALKFIKDRPDLFYRVKKGIYEARNPEIVRSEEKILDKK